MAELTWDAVGEHLYETGTKNGVLYKQKADGTYDTGVAWNGLTAVTESPSGAEETALYADDIKYLSMRSLEEFGGTIEAYTYPDEFAECDGSVNFGGATFGQQKRVPFGFSFTTVLGNDTEHEGHGYKIHLWYGCTASPSEKSYQTINDSPDAITFSWEVTTQPAAIAGVSSMKPVASITIDSTKADETKLATLKGWLYGTNGTGGTEGTKPRLPSPLEVYTLFTTL